VRPLDCRLYPLSLMRDEGGARSRPRHRAPTRDPAHAPRLDAYAAGSAERSSPAARRVMPIPTRRPLPGRRGAAHDPGPALHLACDPPRRGCRAKHRSSVTLEMITPTGDSPLFPFVSTIVR
jgi:hypothetical protein